MPYFFNEADRSRFPMSWTRKSYKFKEWPRPTMGVEELEILSLFDKLQRKLPTWKLITVYAKASRWVDFKCMLVFSSLSRLLCF